MMKPGVLPDSGNHINFAPTLAVDGGRTTFNNLDFRILFSSWIYSAIKIIESKKKKGFRL